MMEWIKIQDSKPPLDKFVLLFHHHEGYDRDWITIGCYRRVPILTHRTKHIPPAWRFFDSNGNSYESDYVTHWMPLPSYPSTNLDEAFG